MKKQTFACTMIVVLLFQAIPVSAHDYWLEPQSFFIGVKEKVTLHLFLGDALKIEEERSLQKERTIRFQMFSAQGTQDLLALGRNHQVPVGEVTPNGAGNYLVAMERKPHTINLDAEKFTAYLIEEGLNSIIALRERRGESHTPGRERYSRYLKTLLQVGGKRDNTYGRVQGYQLEIVPQSNPYGLKRGDTLNVQVLFEGEPPQGARISAYNYGGGEVKTQLTRTTRDGLAAFRINNSGKWLIRLVHMRPCGSCGPIDWESFWAAYSFGVN